MTWARIECAWCGVEIHPGPEPTSHGICPDCATGFKDEIERKRAADSPGEPPHDGETDT